MKRILIAILTVIISLTSCNLQSGTREEAVKEVPTVLSNTYYRLTQDKELNVAYLGGSITQGQGASKYANNWVALTTKWLTESFPEARINENNAGLSNTGSNYGIFRLDEDVLKIAVPDLIFIEYTSNDWGRFGLENISRQNESIIRRLYEVNPKIDIIFVYSSFSYENTCKTASNALARHYGLIEVDPGMELKRRIDTEEGGDYSKYSGDKIHPSDAGYAVYLDFIAEQLQRYLIDEAPAEAKYLDANVPEALNKSGLFMSPKMIDPLLFDIPEGFSYEEKNLKMCKIQYDHYVETEQEGAEYEFTFDGTGFGLLVYKCPTVSNIAYSVDGSEFKDYKIGDMHNYNHGQMYIIEYDLAPGTHTVKIKNTPSSYGTTLRIVKLCVNE